MNRDVYNVNYLHMMYMSEKGLYTNIKYLYPNFTTVCCLIHCVFLLWHSFKDTYLTMGAAVDPKTVFRTFMGRDPTPEPFLAKFDNRKAIATEE